MSCCRVEYYKDRGKVLAVFTDPHHLVDRHWDAWLCKGGRVLGHAGVSTSFLKNYTVITQKEAFRRVPELARQLGDAPETEEKP